VNCSKFLTAFPIVLGVCAASHADVLLDQPVDFRNRWDSFYAANVGGIQFGDDFIIAGPTVVESATFFMVATPGGVFNWSMSVHRGSYDHDIYPFAPLYDHFYRQFNPSSVIDLGPWPGQDNVHLFEVRFDNMGLLLKPYLDDERAYWFSCAGHLLNYPPDQCNWATAGDGVINGDMGYFKYATRDWPGWSLMTRGGMPPTDFAMRIEGVSADEWQPTTELTFFEVDYGSHASGELDDLREAGEDEVVTVLSRVSRRDGFRYNTMTFITKTRCLIENPDVLDVSVSADVQRIFVVPEATLSFFNHRTGEWDEVGRHDIYLERDTWPFRDIPAANYLDDNNEIEMKFEVLGMPNGASHMTYSFTANIDRVQIDARRVD